MLWTEVEYLFGKRIADKMGECPYLDGITLTMVDGEADIPLSDIRNAFKWYRGVEVNWWDLD